MYHHSYSDANNLCVGFYRNRPYQRIWGVKAKSEQFLVVTFSKTMAVFEVIQDSGYVHIQGTMVTHVVNYVG